MLLTFGDETKKRLLHVVSKKINCLRCNKANDSMLLDMQKGVKHKDALHIACAITAKCGYFLTTDSGILKKHFDEILVVNPLDFVRKLGG